MKRNFERLDTVICSSRIQFPTFAEQKYSVRIRILGLSDYDRPEEDCVFQWEYVLTPCGNSIPTGWDTLEEKEAEAELICDLLPMNPCETKAEKDKWCWAYDTAKAEYDLRFEML